MSLHLHETLVVSKEFTLQSQPTLSLDRPGKLAPIPEPDFLQELLEEGQSQYEEAKAAPKDSFDFLDELVNESMRERSDREQLKQARKENRHSNLTSKQREHLQATIRELELRAEWIAQADAIWIKRCVCEQCGSETPQFAGYFTHLVNRHTKVDRWVACSSEYTSTLPREMKVEMTSVAMCADCIPAILIEDGWLTADAEDPFAANVEFDDEAEGELQEELQESAAVPGQIWEGDTQDPIGDAIEEGEVNGPGF